MANKIIPNTLAYIKKPSRWSAGIGAELPAAYKKFWREWKLTTPAAVHYVEKKGHFALNETSGVIEPVQNIPLPLKFPKELNDGIWGGEAVVQGFTKHSKWRRRTPRFWVPNLQKSVVYSEVLDTYMRVTVTNRALRLIHENYGFDHYLLKTPACDLRSELALSIKRKILLSLADKTLYPDDPEKREEVYAKYKQYLEAYTREEIEWFGLTYKEACKKHIAIKASSKVITPLKMKYRANLIEQLKEAKIKEAMEAAPSESESKSGWISKINPFAKTTKEQ